jgi:hypothetical protein
LPESRISGPLQGLQQCPTLKRCTLHCQRPMESLAYCSLLSFRTG